MDDFKAKQTQILRFVSNHLFRWRTLITLVIGTVSEATIGFSDVLWVYMADECLLLVVMIKPRMQLPGRRVQRYVVRNKVDLS